MAIALVKGSKYWAGASRPFFVSQSMVTGYLQGKGFTNIAWHKRREPLPAGINPQAEPGYDDDWDEWVSADYQGATGSLSPPTSIPWLVVHLPSVAAQTSQAPVAAPGVPSWVTSSQQAGYAAAQAAAQAAAAAASARRGSGVSSGSVAPANSTPEATPSAPRESQGANAGAAVAAVGVLIVLGTLATAILRRRRR